MVIVVLGGEGNGRRGGGEGASTSDGFVMATRLSLTAMRRGDYMTAVADWTPVLMERRRGMSFDRQGADTLSRPAILTCDCSIFEAMTSTMIDYAFVEYQLKTLR